MANRSYHSQISDTEADALRRAASVVEIAADQVVHSPEYAEQLRAVAATLDTLRKRLLGLAPAMGK